jgi:hypothetical protein
VAVHDLAVVSGEHGNLEPELADAGAHTVHNRIVLPRVTRVEDQTVNGPDLDFGGCWAAVPFASMPHLPSEVPEGAPAGMAPLTISVNGAASVPVQITLQ